MSLLGWVLASAACICLLFAIAFQLDAMEARYQQRLRDWHPNETGAARVVDFEAWRRSADVWEFRWSHSPEQEQELRAEGFVYAGESGRYPSRLMKRSITQPNQPEKESTCRS